MADYDDRYRPRVRPTDDYRDSGPRRGPPVRDLPYRQRDDSVEDIERAFSPPGAPYYRSRDVREVRQARPPPRRARSVGRRPTAYDGYDDDDDEDDDGGYTQRRRRPPVSRKQSGYYSDTRQVSPRRSDRRKSTVEDLADNFGLGAAFQSISKGRSKSRSRAGDRRRRDHSDSSSEGTRSRDKREGKIAQAAQAALVAGAIEAFRARNEPGPWTGAKGRRVATTALGAAGIDGLVDGDPDRKGKRHVAEAVLGGLLTNHIANGPRDRSPSYSENESGSRRSQRRSASRGRRGSTGLKDLAGAGAVVAAGKAIFDRVRSKSRNRGSKRSSSTSSDDGYMPARDRRAARTRRNRGNNGPGRSNNDYRNDNVSRDATMAAGAGVGAGTVGRSGPGSASTQTTRTGEMNKDEGSSSTSTTDMEMKRKSMRGKELITAGLATIATIHAAHGVYSSMEASGKRHKLVVEHKMSPVEARKLHSKGLLQDAAAIGIAALGIKGAFSEWKEMKEQRQTIHDLEKRRRQRKKRREQREREETQRSMMAGGGGGGGGGMPGAIPYIPYPAYAAMPYGAGQGSFSADPYPVGGLTPPPHPRY